MYWRLIFSGAVLCFCACSPEAMWDGAMLVADGYQARLVGSFADGWHAPDGLVAAGDDFYLADEAGAAVWRWRPGQSPHMLADAACGIRSPEDLVRDAAGNHYFTDDDAGGVWRVTFEGECAPLAGSDKGLASTEGLALLPDGSLVVGESSRHKLFRVSQQGQVEEFKLSQPIAKPESIACDPEGNLYIADDTADTIYRVTSGGDVSILLDVRDGLQTCESLCWADGGLVITDDQAGKLYRWTPRTGLTTLAQLAGRLKNIQGVTTALDGTILITIQTSLARRQGYLLELRRGTTTQSIPLAP
jgi:sugar lactone lactonase YvrE